MSESDIQQDVVKMLCLHPKVAWCMVITTGKFKVKGGYVTTGHYIDETQRRFSGMSDITGQLKDGRFLAIETKQPGEKPTDIQRYFMDLVRKNGGVSGWADNVEDAKIIIDSEYLRFME